MSIQYNNLLTSCRETLKSENTIIYITNYEFWLCILSMSIIDHPNQIFTINKYSDEWLYLIDYNYPNNYYQNVINVYNNVQQIIMSAPMSIIYINEHVIQLFTTFSRGAVHGYSGFYYTIIVYINNIKHYKYLKLLLYKDSDKGILDIVHHLCNINVINPDNIIYVEKEKMYHFLSVTYIKNEYHVFNGELLSMMDDFIHNYIPPVLSLPRFNNICILKTNETQNIKGRSGQTLFGRIPNNIPENDVGVCRNITQDGSLDIHIVNDFCMKHNIENCTQMGEIEVIQTIQNCKTLIIHYGSKFFKNFVYISDKCEKIIVIVNGSTYINDYNHLSSIIPTKYQGIIMKKYKNADIKYVMANANMDFDPYTI